jgi:hypothetical protein
MARLAHFKIDTLACRHVGIACVDERRLSCEKHRQRDDGNHSIPLKHTASLAIQRFFSAINLAMRN